MEREFLQLSYWDQFTAREAEAVGQALARCLPASWAFGGVEHHAMGDQKRHVAFFTWQGARFALIPGGEVTLGYDRSRPFVPAEEDLEDWRRAAAAAQDTDWAGFLDQYLTPLRRVAFAPFLLEVEATPYGQVTAPEGEPVEGVDGALIGAYVEFTAEGRFVVYKRRITFKMLCAELAEDGFRLPTSDQWEYACSGGSRTLWRWGDDLFPSRWGGDYCAQSPGPDEEPLPGRPNAFGLRIAFDSYEDELCGPPPVWRGGDGGCSLCGGEGLLAWQIVFASAYYCPVAEGDEGTLDSPNVRRAFPLPPDCFD